MTSESWASVIIAPVAFVLFVLFATRLFIVLTKRSLRFHWIRTITGLESDDPHASGDILIAIGAVTVSQFLATVLLLEGFIDDPVAPVGFIGGAAEWCAAIAWVGLLIVGSSPPNGGTGGGPDLGG